MTTATRRAVLRGGLAATGCAAAGTGPLAAAPRRLHVAPSGDDRNDGAPERPLRSLGAARRLARQQGPAEVVIADGVYAETLALGPEDSGCTYRAAPGARPALTAARRIAAEAFRPVTDPAALARLQPQYRERIVALDLRAQGLRRTGPYPDLFTGHGGLLELYLDGKRAPLARYPKRGSMTVRTVLATGEAGGPGRFAYRDPRPARWIGALAPGLWLRGTWSVPWRGEAVRVAAIDPAARTITLAAPVPGGIGSAQARPAGSGREPFHAFNLLEELDQPGEWCVDVDSRTLYLYPPRPLADLDIRIADETGPVLAVTGATGVTVAGLALGESLGDGILVEGGSGNRVTGCTVANVARYGIRLKDGRDHAAFGNDVHDTGAGGIWLGGGDEAARPRVPAGHRAENNHVWNVGILDPAEAPGINCGFTGGHTGGHHAAVGMRVANNLIHDAPQAAILHGSWDSVIEFNEIFRCGSVFNDTGGIACHDLSARSGNRRIRFNFLHNLPIGDGIAFDGDSRDDVVEGNVVWRVAGAAVSFGRGISAENPLLLAVLSNLAVDCGTGYRLAARRGSRIAGNLAVRCRVPFDWLTGPGPTGQDPQGDVSSGPNAAFVTNPGFADDARHDFALRPDSAPVRQTGYQPPPLARIGLMRDAFRSSLPDPAALRRWNDPDPALRVTTAIKDRP